jgi:hypothetical protein
LFQNFIRDVITLGKSGVPDFERAVPNIKEHAAFITLGASELTDSDTMRRHCARLSTTTRGGISHHTAEGLTHLYGGSAGARALLLASALPAHVLR